jgi:hypothetical protein
MSTAVREVEVSPVDTVSNHASGQSSAGTPPEAVLTQMITGSLGSQAVYVAAQLG